MIDYYNLLGIAPAARPEEIRSAFRRQAKAAHPDAHPHLTGSERELLQRRFIQLAQAYEILSDPEKRRNYDRGWRSARARKSAAGQQPGKRAAPAGGRKHGGKKAGRAQAATGAAGRPGKAPGESREEDIDDLFKDVEHLLTKFGVDMRNEIEAWLDKTLDWALTLFMEVVQSLEGMGKEPGEAGGAGSPSKGAPRRGAPAGAGAGATASDSAPGHKPPPRQPSEREMEEELAALKKQVHSAVKQAEEGKPTEESVEEELERIKSSLRKGS